MPKTGLLWRILVVRSRLLPGVVFLSLMASAASATVPEDQFAALHWRSIGPTRGGRVLAVSGVPGQPDRFYFGSVNGGVWTSDDAGRTWRPISDQGIPNGSIGALAVAPSDPNILYVGTGEADMRSDISQGIGAYKSTDAGKTWSPTGLKDSQAIGKILVDPRNPDVVLAAALGHPYGANDQRGVFRSSDGGKTWTRTLFRNTDTGAIDMAFEPGNPDVVYASLWQTRRPPWSVYPPSMGPGGGLFKSSDGGRTWAEITAHGLPKAPGHIGIAVAASNPKRVFALVDAKEGGGLYRSDDAGASFAKVSDDKRIWERGWYFGGVTVNPKNPDQVFISDVSVYRSDDGGKSFIPVKGAPGGDDYHVLWIDPNDPNRQMLGVDQGAVVTLNGGQTWSSWYNQSTAQMYHVITDNRFPYWVYGSQQDSGAAGVPSRNGSVDGIALTDFKETTAGGESDSIAPDPDDPDTVFGGRVDKLDLKTGQTRSVDPTLKYPDHYRGEWTQPLIFSKLDPKALYYGNQRVFRTRDGGEHWDAISPDLTRADPAVPKGLDKPTVEDEDHIGPRRGVVYTIAPSPVTAGLIWAGTDDGLVWKTADDGKTWTDVTPKALGAWSKVGIIDASRFDPQTAYLAVDRHRLDDFKPYAFVTHDGGKSWKPIGAGLEGDGPLNAVNVVREDSRMAGLLYAGTERGAFVSFDDGGSWQRLGRDLPPTSVRDIDVHDDDVVIATHGRGFYVMDDVAPLRELAAGKLDANRLFAPAIAYRARPWGFTGTPMPKDEPRSPNPPDGAYIDYYLAAASPGPVEISIFDAEGTRVQHWSSTDPLHGPDVTKLRLTPDWIETPLPPSAAPGMHRFVWDLHYALQSGEAADGDPFASKGVWARPGTYRVELSAGGKTLRQSLELKPDPRVKLTAQDYEAEFRLARRAEAATVKVKAATTAAGALHERLVKAAAGADKKRKAPILALDAELTAFAEIRPDKAPKSPTSGLDRLDGLGHLSATLQSLYQALDGADAAPSPDARAGLEAAEAQLKALTVQLEALQARAREVLGEPR